MILIYVVFGLIRISASLYTVINVRFSFVTMPICGFRLESAFVYWNHPSVHMDCSTFFIPNTEKVSLIIVGIFLITSMLIGYESALRGIFMGEERQSGGRKHVKR